MRPVDLAPVLGKLRDRLAFPAQQRVQRLLRTGLGVVQPPGRRPGLPAQHPHVVDAQSGRRAAQRPARPLASVIDQVEQAGLDVRVHPGGTRPAVSPNAIFPGSGAAPPPARSPWPAAAPAPAAGLPASSALRPGALLPRQMCTTVDRSTPNFSAASRWVACCVRTWVNSSYFSLGASRFLGLRDDLGVEGHLSASNGSRHTLTRGFGPERWFCVALVGAARLPRPGIWPVTRCCCRTG